MNVLETAKRVLITHKSRMLAQTAAALLAIAHSTGAEVAQEASRVTSNLPDYTIDVRIDFRAAKLSGRQRVSLNNSSREATENLFFHLYPNVGIDIEGPLTLNVLSVTIGGRRAQFALQGRSSVLRINLPEKLAPGAACTIDIEFSATVPAVPKEETSLISHFLEEISDAMGDQTTSRARREFFFKSGNTMLLGYFFPLLAEGDIRDPERLPISGIKGVVYSDLANFDVTVETESDLNVISSGEIVPDAQSGRGAANPSLLGSTRKLRFKGSKLRSFALVVAERMKKLDRDVGGVSLSSYVRPENERIGLQVLATAAKALETYGRTFGPHPYPSLKVVEIPLPASFSGIDLPGIVALADAYYIDFESKQPDLPSIVREQADVIKSALEFTLVHEIAHSWWGGAVGSDPQRAPYVDEALAHFSAIYFYELNPGDTTVESVIDQQVRGTYYAYRLFGGADMEVESPLKDFKTRIQYAAIVQAKGAFLLLELRREMGDERFFKTLKAYYNENLFGMSTPERLRNAFIQAAADPRAMRAQLRRWLNEKHADEDIGSPPATLVTQPGGGMKKLGRVFVWIGRTAARPF